MNFSLYLNMSGFCSDAHNYINLKRSHELTNKQDTCECCKDLQKIVHYRYIVTKSI